MKSELYTYVTRKNKIAENNNNSEPLKVGRVKTSYWIFFIIYKEWEKKMEQYTNTVYIPVVLFR